MFPGRATCGLRTTSPFLSSSDVEAALKGTARSRLCAANLVPDAGGEKCRTGVGLRHGLNDVSVDANEGEETSREEENIRCGLSAKDMPDGRCQ